MELTKENADSIVSQVQQAHRISVGFYRRILPTLDLVSDQLGCSFWYWEPMHTARPGKNKSQPSKSWAWDYVPLFASAHVYRHVSGDNRTELSDYGIRFELYIEDSFCPEKWEGNLQPDAVFMPKGNAVLRAFVYSPTDTFADSFDVLWEEEAEIPTELGTWKKISEHWNGIELEWPLSELILDFKPIVNELRSIIARN